MLELLKIMVIIGTESQGCWRVEALASNLVIYSTGIRVDWSSRLGYSFHLSSRVGAPLCATQMLDEPNPIVLLFI